MPKFAYQENNAGENYGSTDRHTDKQGVVEMVGIPCRVLGGAEETYLVDQFR